MDLQQNPNLPKILAMVGKKLGTDPKALEQDLAAGKFDAVFKKMNPNDAAKLQQLVNNPILAQQVINTPQAQQVLKNVIREAQESK